MRNLCIDAGNTRVKYAIFEAETDALLHWETSEADMEAKINELAQVWGVDNAILSTVRQLETELASKIFANIEGAAIILTADTPCPINNAYLSPKTLGKDRLAAVVGAAGRYPHRPVLVIDAGTCIKYDAIDAQSTYFGGSISPGLAMRYAALAHFTARLPQLSYNGTVLDLVGRDTAGSMRTGVEFGLCFEVEGFIKAYRQRYGEALLVIFTGGDLSFFENMLNNCIFAHPHLLLEGLHQILKYNVNQSKQL